MPITPFHFGPGALVSVAAPRHVSFLSFCAANVLIDVESLRNMVTHQPRIHTFFHTYIGASLAAVAIVALFIPARWLACRLPDSVLVDWRRLGVLPVAIGAALGAWSHVVLDSIMHADITPFAPLSETNPLYQAISSRTLHIACLISGGLAGAWFALRPDTPLERSGDA